MVCSAKLVRRLHTRTPCCLPSQHVSGKISTVVSEHRSSLLEKFQRLHEFVYLYKERGLTMKNTMIWAFAMIVMVAGMVVSTDSAEAGLFDRIKCRRAAKKCCEPAPTCCEVETCGCEVEAACPCEAEPACGCEATPACGCEVETCGCEEPAPSCTTCHKGCEVACSDLNRRQLRRAKRKGECCGCECAVETCGCEAAPSCGCEVSTCGCETAVEGCSDCAGPAIESSESAPETAPEAPESDSTT